MVKPENASHEANSGVQLSKGILEMKFMKKSKEKVRKQLEEKESRELYSKQITEEMKKTGNIVFVESSIYNCKDMSESLGRFSFGGMNPDIEKLMSNEYAAKLEELERAKEKDVSDLEMAKNLASVVGTVEKKFQKKSKKKFMKPPSNDF